MSPLTYRLGYSTALAICLVSGCTATVRLPTIIPPTEDYYPAASKRLKEEGRVLVEFHLNQRRVSFDQKMIQSEGSVRLESGAIKVVRALRLDPSDHTKPDPKHAYRVTIIFCLEPGHCGTLSAFPGTEPIVVKSQPLQLPLRDFVTD